MSQIKAILNRLKPFVVEAVSRTNQPEVHEKVLALMGGNSSRHIRR
jgi:hypothetical protein